MHLAGLYQTLACLRTYKNWERCHILESVWLQSAIISLSLENYRHDVCSTTICFIHIRGNRSVATSRQVTWLLMAAYEWTLFWFSNNGHINEHATQAFRPTYCACGMASIANSMADGFVILQRPSSIPSLLSTHRATNGVAGIHPAGAVVERIGGVALAPLAGMMPPRLGAEVTRPAQDPGSQSAAARAQSGTPP